MAPQMICPNCQHEQTSDLECESCGIIIAKYLKRQRELAEQAALASDKEAASLPPSKSLVTLVFCFIGGMLLAGIMSFYFIGSQDKRNESESPIAKLEQVAPSRQKTVKRTRVVEDKAFDFDDYGLKMQLSRKFPARNSVEVARNATVFIQTSWGSGSGFFVDDQGRLVTSRHVIEFDPDKLATLQQQLVDLKENIELENNNIRTLDGMLSSGKKIDNRRYYEKALDHKKRYVAKYQQQYDSTQIKIREIKNNAAWPNITVILIDGSEHTVIAMQVSQEYDLALLTIAGDNSPYIKMANSQEMQQGEKLYTVGNPAGMRHTVTSGVFSGYRMFEDTLFLQTDAPINPGNSGGPLLNRTGRVIGVNTMILQRTEGIGFAIPIETVLEQFPLVLR